jgi:hypothetical protein
MYAMPVRANADDEAALESFARALADAIDAALPAWVERSVARFVPLDTTAPPPDDGTSLADTVAALGTQVRDEVGGRVRALLETDIDEQRASPLALLRSAVRQPTELLRSLGVAPVQRDDFDVRNFPDDVYGLVPTSFADVDASLQDPGLRWGAAKAHVFKQRRRAEGTR